MSDQICPTFAAGAMSVISGGGVGDFLNDCYSQATVITGGTQACGYLNSIPSTTVGSFNNDWTNGYLTQSKTPTYSSGLLSFGNTGLQS